MVANNLIEVYSLMFAWGMYGAIWDILTGSGIALVPFIVAIISNFADSYTAGNDADDVIRDLEFRVVAIVLVLILCVIPYKGWGVSLSAVKYDIAVNDCNPPPNTQGDGDDTGTSLDDRFSSMGGGLEIHKPVAWSLITFISSAITNTAIKSMQCVNNYEFLLMRMSNITVQNDVLRERLGDFYEQCYLLAQSRYKAIGGTVPANVTEQEDIDWIGSRIFLNTVDEYYSHEEAFMEDMERYGFSRQQAIRDSDAARTRGAHPYCKEVWLGEEGPGVVNEALGLRQLILDDIPVDDAGDVLEDWMDWGYRVVSPVNLTDTIKQDLFIKTILQAEAANLQSRTELDMSGTLDTDRAWGKAIYDLVVGGTGAALGVREFLQASTIRQLMKIAGPIVLALMQMVVIMASPIVMVLANFRFTAFTALTITYFSLEFINAIWAASYWMDNNLLAYYVSEARWFDNPANSAILTAVTGMSTVFLPVIWLAIMGYAGSGMVRGMGAMGVGQGSPLGSQAFSGRFRRPKKK
ncbi:conjugal transfer protein TraG N-terminal domain-containing protein (plasmid) [Microbulbifer sp. TRSA002]|uniref:conjugal transfer protein TraG N-terminal domain-containing protein n=1 Tax=Microbulbifer sp. TRSA002 TaxID=3243382 RepID=UPI0040390BFB